MMQGNLLKWRRILAFFAGPAEGFPRVLVLLSLLLMPTFVLAIDAKSVPSVSKELKALSAKIQKLNKQKLEQEGEVGALQLQLRDLEKRIARNQKTLKSLDGDIKRSSRTLAKLNKEISREKTAEKTASAELTKTLQYIYKTSFEKKGQHLLQPSLANDYLLNLHLLKYAQDAQARHLETVSHTLADLKSLESRAKSELATKESLKQKSIAAKQDLNKAKKQRSQTVAKLNQSLRSSQKQLENLDANRRQLTELLERLRFAADNPELLAEGESDFASLQGRLSWPVKGKVTKTGQAPGVTIYAPEGRKVRAISQGRVVFSDWMRGFGLLIIIDHGNGFMSLYGHNQALFKQLGDWVEAGTAISTIGASGGREQAGLYFEIRREAKPLDPRSWCS